MTRQAVMDGFEQFVADALEETGEEFEISGVIGGSSGGMIDSLLGDSNALHEALVEPELAEYQEQTIQQFEVLLDYVESEESIDEFRDDILETGPFSNNIKADLPQEKRDAVLDRLVERQRRLGNAVGPLVVSEQSEFWDAAREELAKGDAIQLVETNFAFTGPLKEHRDAFAMTTTLNPEEIMGGLGGMLGSSSMEIEYTDEALRAMRHAERQVISEVKEEIDQRFEEE